VFSYKSGLFVIVGRINLKTIGELMVSDLMVLEFFF
jgi:hypothetical protein